MFVDGLGRRVLRVVSADATPTEHLVLNPVLLGHDGFMAALKERVSHLRGRRLTGYARVHALDLDGPNGAEVVFEHVRGWRLADVLDVAESENLTLDIGVVVLMLRQLLPAAAMLYTQGRDVSSGALGPEHLILTPQGRIVLTDYVFGRAIDSLQMSPEGLWRTLRVATPPAGSPISQRGDVVQVGVTVLSLIVGRRLRDDEFPERLESLVSSARQKTPSVIDAPLAPALRDWVLRALQLAPKPFDKLFDAQVALERVLTSDAALMAEPAELDQATTRIARFMPIAEVPAPPEEPVLLEAPPADLMPAAAAFDRPQAPPARAAASAPATSSVVEPEPEAVVELVADAPMPAPTRRSGVRKKKAAAKTAPEALGYAVSEEVAPAAPQTVDAVLEPVPDAALVAAVPTAPSAVVLPEAALVEDFGLTPVDVPPAVEATPVRTSEPPQWSQTPASERAFNPPAPSPSFDPPRAVASPVVSAPPLPEPPASTVLPPVGDSTALAAAAGAPWWQSARVVAALVAVALLETAYIGWQTTRPQEALGSDGELVVQSRPEGARVILDDREHGVTPLTVRVSAGTHVLQVQAGTSEPRVIPLSIRPGTQTAQYIELMGVSTTGVLEVRTEPSKARVTVDGRPQGSTPLTLRDVTPGDHQVVIERGGWTSTQTVRVEPGGTAQLVVPIR